MGEINLPSRVTGSGEKFPYLARITDVFVDFTSFIILVEKKKQTVLFGKYTGPHENIHRRYAVGSTFEECSLISSCNLMPFNKGR